MTYHDPATITFDGERFIGAAGARPYNPDSRVAAALADRLRGMTWGEIATLHAYRSARAAEHNVGRYVAWLNGQRVPATRRTTPATRRTTPATRRTTPAARPTMSTRRYGVEIEFQGCTMAAAAEAISRALGRHVSTAGYHSSLSYREWRVESDSSVGRNGRGGEAISPIMSGPEGLAELDVVVAAIRSVGGRVSRSCGIHVHVDATDLTGEQIARLMVAYVDRQEAFNALVAPSRRTGLYGNRYCQGMRETEKLDVVENLKRERTPGICANRYRTVNVTTLRRTGTVEFRQHQGSLNGTKIGAWVKMMVALAAAVTAAADEELPTTPAELITALEAHGLDAAAARNLAARIER